jgi:hypothetical protein
VDVLIFVSEDFSNVSKQNFGTSMGNSLSPFTANFFMADFEQKMKRTQDFLNFAVDT